MNSLLQKPSRSLSRTVREIKDSSPVRSHPVMSVMGGALLLVALGSVVMMLPDIKRYLRMRSM